MIKNSKIEFLTSLFLSFLSCRRHPIHHSPSSILKGYLSCKIDSSISTSDSHSHPIKIQELTYKDLQLATANFSDSKLLSRGRHDRVYKAVLSSGRLVTVKKPSANDLNDEIDILTSLYSPSLVNLLGFSTNFHGLLLILVEFMSNDTLYDVLHTNPRPPTRRLRLALQIARAGYGEFVAVGGGLDDSADKKGEIHERIQ